MILLLLTGLIEFAGFAVHWWLNDRYGNMGLAVNSAEDFANSKGGKITPSPKFVTPVRWKHPYLRLGDVMMVIVSFAVLASALFIILSQKYDDAAEKWAFGMVGSLIGFWCKRSR